MDIHVPLTESEGHDKEMNSEAKIGDSAESLEKVHRLSAVDLRKLEAKIGIANDGFVGSNPKISSFNSKGQLMS